MKKLINITLLVTVLFILSNSLSPGVSSVGISLKVGLFLEPMNPFNDFQTFHMFIRKCAHFSEFAFFGCLVFASHHTKSLPKHLALTLLVLPFIDEGIQLFVSGRSGNLIDVCIDYSGIAFAFICYQLWLRFKIYRSN